MIRIVLFVMLAAGCGEARRPLDVRDVERKVERLGYEVEELAEEVEALCAPDAEGPPEREGWGQ